MSDWSMYELEDIVWDEFGESGDHIVPHPSVEQGGGCVTKDDCHKKQRREAGTTVKKSSGSKSIYKDAIQGKEETSFSVLKNGKAPMIENGSWSRAPNDVFSDMCDADCIKEEKMLTSEDVKASPKCFKSNNIDAIDNELLEKDATLGNGDDVIGSSMCSFPLDEISPTESDLGFFGSANEDKESCDLLYYGWPDIGNFEDVDRMFRNCDSTFGQGTTTNDDDLSWFSSSSRAYNGSEDAFKSGFKSSYSEASDLNGTSKKCEAEMKFVPETGPPLIIDSDKKNVSNEDMSSQMLDDMSSQMLDDMNSQMLDADGSNNFGHSYENWVNTESEDKREHLLKKQVKELNQGVAVKLSTVDQSGNENGGVIGLEGKQSKHLSQLEGRADRFPEYSNCDSLRGYGIMQQSADLSTSGTQVFSSPSIAQQEKNFGSGSFNYMHTYIPYVHTKYNHPSHQISVMPTTSGIKSDDNSHLSLSSKASSYASTHGMPTKMPLDPSPKCRTSKSDNNVKRLLKQHQPKAADSIDPQHEGLAGQPLLTYQVPLGKQLYQSQDEMGDHAVAERPHIKLPAEVDSSTIQEGSCVSSVLSDDISLEATTFHQLQYVMEQLDERTKLCIRDSLYRLARNAAQRCNAGNLKNSGSDSKDNTRLLTPEESDRYTGFMDIETDTNPIDRSIAYLLFHRPSDPSTRPPNDGFSLIHRTVSSQPLVHENMVGQEEASGSDTKLLADERS